MLNLEMTPSNPGRDFPNEDYDGYESEENVSRSAWFSSNKIGAFATRLRDSIPSASAAVRQTLDGIVDVISMSAASIAMEFNELERESREQTEKIEEKEVHVEDSSLNSVISRDSASFKNLVDEDTQQSMERFVQCCNKAFSKLPWEVWKNDKQFDAVCVEDKSLLTACENSIHGSFVEDSELKHKILALCLDERTFTEPFLDNDALVIENCMRFGGDSEYDAQYCYFEQKKRITDSQFLEENQSTIARLLEADVNLLKAHDELVGSRAILSEGVFWKNYFFHCERMRITLQHERRTKKITPTDFKNGSLEEMDYSSTKDYLKDDEFGDAVFVSKFDASDDLPQDNSTYVQKYPQTLSNGSIVLIGNDEIDLEQYSQKS